MEGGEERDGWREGGGGRGEGWREGRRREERDGGREEGGEERDGGRGGGGRRGMEGSVSEESSKVKLIFRYSGISEQWTQWGQASCPL